MNRSGTGGRARAAALLALVALGVACGGGGEGGGAPAPPAGTDVGPAGGTVTGPSGAQVVIPPSALTTTVRVAVTRSSAGAPALPSGTHAVGSMYAFTPHGTAFAVPATITVPFDPAALGSLTPALLKTDDQGQWVELASSVTGSALTAAVTGFSYALAIGRGTQVTVSASRVTGKPSAAGEADGTLIVDSLSAAPTDLGGDSGLFLDANVQTARGAPASLQVTLNLTQSRVENVTFSWLSGETTEVVYCVEGSPGLLDCVGATGAGTATSGRVDFADTLLTLTGDIATSARLTGSLEYGP